MTKISEQRRTECTCRSYGAYVVFAGSRAIKMALLTEVVRGSEAVLLTRTAVFIAALPTLARLLCCVLS